MTDNDNRLLDWISGLSPREKAGQLLMVAPDPAAEPGQVTDWLRENSAGGLFLQWRHLYEREWLYELTDRLSEQANSLPLLVGTDQEGGLVSDLGALINTGPSPAALGALDDVEVSYRVALSMGEKLQALGFNIVFAPSLDIHSEARNPVIGTRAFGASPEQVMKHGMATIEGYARTGLVACVKHFPGHGATRVDSHLALPRVDASLQTLAARDWLPFQAAIEAGIPMVMTAHVAYPAVDATGDPATLSREIVTGLLREDLGYNGVVVTDSLEMKGVSTMSDPGSIAIQAIEAGVDLLLYGLDREMAAEALERLTRALVQGELSEDRVAESLVRLGRLRLAIADSNEAIDSGTRDEILDDHHEPFLREVSAASITLIGSQGPDIPLQWENRHGLFVVPTGHEPRLLVDTEHIRDLVEPLNMELEIVDLKPNEAERQLTITRAYEADYVVACLLSRGALNSEQRLLADGLIATGREVILVSLLDCADLNDFPSVRTRLATHGFGPLVLDGLVEVLLGRVLPNGGS